MTCLSQKKKVLADMKRMARAMDANLEKRVELAGTTTS
jgi:hypothetical protein